MKVILFALFGCSLPAALLTHSEPSPNAPEPAPLSTPVHCQVPCGIYGDKMRIDMLLEDCATIEKGMKMLNEMEDQENPSRNQMVRWVMSKDTHAGTIQEQVASYWLAQRVKAPKDANNKGARDKYLAQLELMHGITVAAMKCKQTTDAAHVEALRTKARQFSETYFSKEDLEHLRGHGEHGKQGSR